MGKSTGFLEYDRIDANHRSVEERLCDWNEFTVPLSLEEQKLQAARCTDCGIPFCHAGTMLGRAVSGCPNGNLIPEWNEMLYRGLMHEAWERLYRTNLIPEFTSRVCPAPCEGACTNGLNGESVCIEQNERLITDVAFESGWAQDSSKPLTRNEHKIAVVGSGPAGLTCAIRLNQLGNNVTVYERADRPGGLLMYGIPNMKLSKDIVNRRITLMKEQGIEFKCNVDVGSDITIGQLEDEYDAVAICAGASQPRDLRIHGRELDNIMFAVDFLTKTTKTLLDEGKDALSDTLTGKNVIVIGGGDTGNDCVGTSIRRGAKSVTQFEIMPEPPLERLPSNPWPEWPAIKKTDYGQQEAIYTQGADPRIYSINSTKFIGEDGKVTGIDTVKVEWKAKKVGARPSPVPIEGTQKHYKADIVLLAMGFTGAESYIIDEIDMPSPRGFEYEGGRPGLFLAGDVRRGQSLVIWAVREGRECADRINKYITS